MKDVFGMVTHAYFLPAAKHNSFHQPEADVQGPSGSDPDPWLHLLSPPRYLPWGHLPQPQDKEEGWVAEAGSEQWTAKRTGQRTLQWRAIIKPDSTQVPPKNGCLKADVSPELLAQHCPQGEGSRQAGAQGGRLPGPGQVILGVGSSCSCSGASRTDVY